ncbi:MAG TPA: ATP-binding protein [Anaeromyxobacteraceae bacterium]|nr:ATP-binding protein [Anaeromyxobacteraceae bacterium]
MTAPAGPFDHVPRTAGGHFVLNVYAAIYRLLNQTRRLAELSGSSLDAVFERFPFLGEYFDEMRAHMPDDLTWDAATAWWAAQLDGWERACPDHLPLRALAEQAGLPFTTRLAFMAIGLVEEDSRFGTLVAELQAPLPHRRPTLELVGQMMMDEAPVGAVDPWTICRPLLAAGIVEVQNEVAPRSEWLLRVPSMLWDAVRGQLAAAPAPWCRVHAPADFPELERLVLPEAFRARLAQAPALLRNGRARLLVLRGAPGSDALQVAGALARALGAGVAAVDGASLAEVPGGARLLGPLCALANLVPVIDRDLAPGETAALPPLAGYGGPIVVTLGEEGGLASGLAESALALSLPAPGPAERRRHWCEAIGEDRIVDLPQIVGAFQLGGGYIRRLAHGALAQAALDRREAVTGADVREASRTLNRQLLDTLASPISAGGGWDDLVAVPGTREKLLDLHRRCRHRETLGRRLGPAFGANAPRGVRALFTGASGTGKTLAARILASILGMDLFRVDLAAVVNKYIGETEKNLHQVLSRAEALDVVLLLDEGDALLGQRTEVKSANDRYANLETNYLLQRLEHYQGIVVVTTNLGDAIDSAFQRRMDVVVPFYPPQPEERLHILRLHLPPDHQVGPALLERIALRCALTGSQIRNAALSATLLALEREAPVGDAHLEAALRSEYRKAGGICPLDGRPGTEERDGGMGSFVAAFARS